MDISAKESIREIYLRLLNREPDQQGMDTWLSEIEKGVSIESIEQEISIGPEYQMRKRLGLTRENHALFIHKLTIWAKNYFREKPLSILNVGVKEKMLENGIYAPLRKWQIPHHIFSFDPIEDCALDYFDESDTNKYTLSLDIIGDGEMHPFFINEPDTSSASLPFNQKMLDRFASLSNYTTMKVKNMPTRTLDSVVPDENSFDFLKFDLPGFELATLQNSIRTLKRTAIIQCEVSFFEMYKGQALFSDIEPFFKMQGFDLIDLRPRARYAMHDTPFPWSQDCLGSAEAIFFRQPDLIKTEHSIISQAIIAMFIYDKPSLASWFIKQLSDGHPLVSYLQETSKLNTQESLAVES